MEELLRGLTDFYADSNYGPFMICYRLSKGDPSSEELLDCGKDSSTVKLVVKGNFSPPARREFTMATSLDQMDLFFDLSAPKRLEALMGISLITFIILVMVAFSTILTENISTVALLPLERMLDVVRHQCAQIFKYTNALQEEASSDEDEEEEDEDEDEPEEKEEETDNEFALLEKAVAKLGAIAALSAQDPAQKMWTENDIMVQNWTQSGERQPLGAAALPPEGNVSERGSVARYHRQSSMMELGRRMSMLLEDSNAIETVNQDVSQEIMDQARTPDLDAFSLNGAQLKALSVRILREHESTKEFVRRFVKPVVLVQFVNVMEATYVASNPFHNFVHAVDVLCWLWMQMVQTKAKRFLVDSEQFALLVAAIGHDLGHLGFNNNFLVATAHELAVIYNDRSPLENMHCWKLFQILGTSDTNLLGSVDKETYKHIRKNIIEAILHTDITKHNEMVKDLSLFYQMNKETLNIEELSAEAEDVLKNNRPLMMNSFLHSADVNNPSRPWEVAEKLAHLCMDEFFSQGDKEKELGIPVGMLNDREMVNRAHSQIGFIEFMIAPWVEALVPMFPDLEFMSDYTAENIQKWAAIWEREVKPPKEQVEKVQLRVQKVVANLIPQKSSKM